MMGRCSCMILATVLVVTLGRTECIQLPVDLYAFYGDMFDKQDKKLIAFNYYNRQRKDFQDDYIEWSRNMTNSGKAEDKRLFDYMRDLDSLATRLHWDDILHRDRAVVMRETLRNFISYYDQGPVNVALRKVDDQYGKAYDNMYNVAFLAAEQAHIFRSDHLVIFRKKIFDLGSDYSLSTGKFFNPVPGLYIIVLHLTVMSENMGHVNIWVNDRIVAAVYYYGRSYGLPTHRSTVSTIATVWLNHGDLVYPKVFNRFKSYKVPESYRTTSSSFFSAVLIFPDKRFG